MTRPDLGSGRVAAAPALPGRGAASDRAQPAGPDDDGPEDNGDEEGLLAPSGAFNAEDDEADRIFAAIDAKMGERRKRRRRDTEVLPAIPEAVSALFADLKRGLTAISASEWDSLPESGDFRAKRTKKTSDRERYTPLPDSVLLGGGAAGGLTEAKERVLGSRLDQITSGAATSIDAPGYLTGLGTQTSTRSAADVGDLKRARLLLNSAVQSNPASADAWISLVRLEEQALEPKRARDLVARACEACPDSEDVWLEAIRLLPREQAADIFARGLEQIPASARLWLKGAELEPRAAAKKELLQRGLQKSPDAAALWRARVELEEDEAAARDILGRAVDFCPRDIDLWLALARLEDHEGARRVLNRARQKNPKNKEVWLAGARLEEAYGNTGLVDKIVARAAADLGLTRADWVQTAVECELGGDVHTARAVVTVACRLAADADAREREDEYTGDAEAAEARGALAVASAFLELAVEAAPTAAASWAKAAALARRRGADADAVLEAAVAACPLAEDLWLALAQHRAGQQDHDGARAVLARAYASVPHSARLWLAASQMELARGDRAAARRVLAEARERLGFASEKVWRRAASLEAPEDAKRLLVQALAHFARTSPKMWIALAQLEAGNPAVAHGVYESALASCTDSEALWVAAAAFERGLGDAAAVSRARVLLERGRMRLPRAEALWLEAVRLELAAEQPAMAKSLLAKALQACPQSGALWHEAIWMEPRPLRKAKASAAMGQIGHNALVYLAIARLMWADRKLAEAREYFERALAQEPANGDVWAAYLQFSREHGTEDETARVLEAAFRNGPPLHGAQWRAYRKQHRERFGADPRALFLEYACK